MLKADEPQVGQRGKDVERKREYYSIIFYPERTWNDGTSGSALEMVTHCIKTEEDK